MRFLKINNYNNKNINKKVFIMENNFEKFFISKGYEINKNSIACTDQLTINLLRKSLQMNGNPCENLVNLIISRN